MKTTFIALAVAFVISTNAYAGSWFAANDEGKPLERAHAAFLKKEYGPMTSALREALQESDPVVQRNALDLLETAYAETEGKLPSGWVLPQSITKMKAVHRRFHRAQKDDFGFKISGNAPKGTITQLQLIRYPDQVILDKNKNIGEWSEEIDPEDGAEYELDGPRMAEPLPDGLYLINVETNAGVTNGWFIFSRMTSSATPVVDVPAVGESYSTPNPVMRWRDFHSPEYKPFEKKGLWLGVAAADPWKLSWNTWKGDPTLEEIVVDTKLTPGQYLFYAAYRESRRFGPLQLGRESVTVRPFTIKR